MACGGRLRRQHPGNTPGSGWNRLGTPSQKEDLRTPGTSRVAGGWQFSDPAHQTPCWFIDTRGLEKEECLIRPARDRKSWGRRDPGVLATAADPACFPWPADAHRRWWWARTGQKPGAAGRSLGCGQVEEGPRVVLRHRRSRTELRHRRPGTTRRAVSWWRQLQTAVAHGTRWRSGEPTSSGDLRSARATPRPPHWRNLFNRHDRQRGRLRAWREPCAHRPGDGRRRRPAAAPNQRTDRTQA